MKYQEVLNFWFETLSPKDWWEKNFELDQKIETQFGPTHEAATKGELTQWRTCAEGRLAEIIVIDQFSRNIFRNDPKSFIFDPLALCLSQWLIDSSLDLQLTTKQRVFAYLPFMHSESAEIHKQAVSLYQQLGASENLAFELKHKEIIDRFGRYPHRNQILGRQSTPEEIEFLKEPGSSF